MLCFAWTLSVWHCCVRRASPSWPWTAPPDVCPSLLKKSSWNGCGGGCGVGGWGGRVQIRNIKNKTQRRWTLNLEMRSSTYSICKKTRPGRLHSLLTYSFTTVDNNRGGGKVMTFLRSHPASHGVSSTKSTSTKCYDDKALLYTGARAGHFSQSLRVSRKMPYLPQKKAPFRRGPSFFHVIWLQEIIRVQLISMKMMIYDTLSYRCWRVVTSRTIHLHSMADGTINLCIHNATKSLLCAELNRPRFHIESFFFLRRSALYFIVMILLGVFLFWVFFLFFHQMFQMYKATDPESRVNSWMHST